MKLEIKSHSFECKALCEHKGKLKRNIKNVAPPLEESPCLSRSEEKIQNVK